MPDKAPFGQWLKQRRKELGLTQEDLADRIGCSYITIHKIEAGARRPSKQIAELLADLFKVSGAERDGFVNFARDLDDGATSANPAAERPSTPHSTGSGSRPGNLPAPLTRLIGREGDVAVLRDMLTQNAGYGGVRLLTLTGSPGIGKTRLALQVALDAGHDFRDGAFFVRLAPVSDPDLVVQTIAETLSLSPQSTGSLLGALQRSVSNRQMLLVLDNFEQVLDASPVVVGLLEAGPELKVMVTSREALLLASEQQFQVPSLETADPATLPSLQTLQNIPAIALFIERARSVKPDFALTEQNAQAVAAICSYLQGVPLAIELAAARVNLLSPREIQARLDHSLSLLAGPTPATAHLPVKQRTLRGAIDWSYALLGAGEQLLLARLGVFAGGCTLSAAQAVCNAMGDLPFDLLHGLASLLDKSLLKREEALGESRYTMLEMIREYAVERLAASAEEEDLRRLHAEYFLALAEGAEMQLRGPHQADWLYRLEEEHDNLRAALRWSLDQRKDNLGLGIAGSLWKFWELHGHLSEGRRWLAAALLPSSSGRDSKLSRSRAKALFAAGRLAERQGDNVSSRPLLEESVTIARVVGDKPLIALALHNLANLATYEGDYAAGHKFAEESLAIRTEMGDRWGMANTLHNMGFQAEMMGDFAASGAFFQQSLTISRELEDDWGIAYSLDGLALLKLEQADYSLANALLEESLALRRALGDKSGIARSFERLARVAGRQGQAIRAARLFGAAEVLREKEDIPILPVDRPIHEQSVAQARANLTDAEWRNAWTEGRDLTLEQAADYASESSR